MPFPDPLNSALILILAVLPLGLVLRALSRLHRGEVVSALPLALGLSSPLILALWSNTWQLQDRMTRAMTHDVPMARQTLMAHAMEHAIATQLFAGVVVALLCGTLVVGSLSLTVPGERPRLAVGNTALILGGAVVLTAIAGVWAQPRVVLAGRVGLYALAAFGTASAMIGAHRRGPGVQLGTLAGIAFPLLIAGTDQATLAWFLNTELRAIAIAPPETKQILLGGTLQGLEILRGFSGVHLALAAGMALLGPLAARNRERSIAASHLVALATGVVVAAVGVGWTSTVLAGLQ